MKRLLLTLCLLLPACAVVVIPGPGGTYQALSRPGGNPFDRQRQVANRSKSVCEDQNRMVESIEGPADLQMDDGHHVQTKLVFRCVDPPPAPKPKPEG